MLTTTLQLWWTALATNLLLITRTVITSAGKAIGIVICRELVTRWIYYATEVETGNFTTTTNVFVSVPPFYVNCFIF